MALTVCGLKKEYDAQVVLKDVGFTVESGRFFTVLGDSGSGKSTLLKVIAGLVPADGGGVFADGREISTVAPEKRGFGYVAQTPLLFPHMNVGENIAFGLKARKYSLRNQEKRVKEIASALQIWELLNRMPHTLSGGQQQRVAIGRAIAPHPSLLLMDEPFSALDPSLREEMGRMIKDLQRKIGLTILFITHDINEALTLSDQMAILQDGAIIMEGTPDQVYYAPASPAAASFTGEWNMVAGKVEQGIFCSPLGSLAAPQREEGPARLFLRPRCILPSVDEKGAFKVESLRRLGHEYRLQLGGNGIRLTAYCYDNRAIKEGDRVRIALAGPYRHWLAEEFAPP